MEAAGVEPASESVEPASESTPSQASTCVAALECFATHVEERRKPWAASPDLSRRHASEQPVATSLHL